MTGPKSSYPEHEKLTKVSDISQEIGSFLEWLRSSETPYYIAELETVVACEASSSPFSTWRNSWSCIDGRRIADEEANNAGEDLGECSHCDGTGVIEPENPRLYPARIGIEQLLALYFGIDLVKLNAEKDEMLEEIRKSSE